jgi:hypothetical protein
MILKVLKDEGCEDRVVERVGEMLRKGWGSCGVRRLVSWAVLRRGMWKEVVDVEVAPRDEVLSQINREGLSGRR